MKDHDMPSVALHYLMTRFVETGCPQVAWAIAHHIAIVLDNPELSQKHQSSYRKMFIYWQDLANELSRPCNQATQEVHEHFPLSAVMH